MSTATRRESPGFVSSSVRYRPEPTAMSLSKMATLEGDQPSLFMNRLGVKMSFILIKVP